MSIDELAAIGLADIAAMARSGLAVDGVTIDADTAAVLAEWDRLRRRHKARTGQAEAAGRGVHIGRPATVDDATRARAKELRGGGMSFKRIADELGIPRTTVARIVKS